MPAVQDEEQQCGQRVAIGIGGRRRLPSNHLGGHESRGSQHTARFGAVDVDVVVVANAHVAGLRIEEHVGIGDVAVAEPHAVKPEEAARELHAGREQCTHGGGRPDPPGHEVRERPEARLPDVHDIAVPLRPGILHHRGRPKETGRRRAFGNQPFERRLLFGCRRMPVIEFHRDGLPAVRGFPDFTLGSRPERVGAGDRDTYPVGSSSQLRFSHQRLLRHFAGSLPFPRSYPEPNTDRSHRTSPSPIPAVPDPLSTMRPTSPRPASTLSTERRASSLTGGRPAVQPRCAEGAEGHPTVPRANP